MSMNFGPEGPPSFDNIPPEEEKEEQASVEGAPQSPAPDPDKQELTSEEIEDMEKKAEETMTEKQKEVSEDRRRTQEALRDLGIEEGRLRVSRQGGERAHLSDLPSPEKFDELREEHDASILYYLSGKLNGKFVQLNTWGEGTINGEKLPSDVAIYMFKKFLPTVESYTDKDLENIRIELKKQDTEHQAQKGSIDPENYPEEYRKAIGDAKDAGLL